MTLKLLIIPNQLTTMADYIERGCQGIIIGLKDLSTNFNVSLTLEEIECLHKQYPQLELFVSMNKNYFNSELPQVEQALQKLDQLSIKAVLFYDLSILYIKQKLNLKLDLVWNQTHMVTNYNTCNYYYDMGVKYGLLSTEITLAEINEIQSKTKMQLMAFAYGYPIMAHSRRQLLTNYYLSQGKNYEGKPRHIYDQHNSFVLKEDATGTTFINNSFVNGSCLITSSSLPYIIISLDQFPEAKGLSLVSLVQQLLTTKNERIVDQIEELIGTDTNFFFKKTIYTVKKDV